MFLNSAKRKLQKIERKAFKHATRSAQLNGIFVNNEIAVAEKERDSCPQLSGLAIIARTRGVAWRKGIQKQLQTN